MDNISYGRLRERKYTPRVLHNGFHQFEHVVRSVPAGGHRVSGLFRLFRINVVGRGVSEVSS